MFQIKGRIHKIFEINQITEKFRKRPFVLEVQSNGYTEYIQFDLLQGHCHLIDQFNEGDEVVVFFHIKGRKWESPTGETRYFNTLHVWQILPYHSNADESITDMADLRNSFDTFTSFGGDVDVVSYEEDPNDLPF